MMIRPVVLAAILLTASSAAATSAVSMKLSADNTVRLGQPTIIHILVRNNSSRPITFAVPVGSVEEDCSVLLLRADGDTVSKTDYGRALAGQYSGPNDPAHDYKLSGSYQFIHLMPSEAVTEKIDLSSIFQIDHRGRYQVQIERGFFDNPSVGIAKSDKIFFDVQ